MATATPARLYCTLAGAALVIVGVIGFFYSSGFGTGTHQVTRDTEEIFGLLAVNGWHNLAHIALGALALFAAGSAARAYALGAGLLFIVLALWAWIDSDGIILGLLPFNDADIVATLLLGLTGVAAGAATAKPAAERKPREHRRPPEERTAPKEREASKEPEARSKPDAKAPGKPARRRRPRPSER
jgi:hypothetical protein